MGTGEFNAGGNPAMDWHPIQGGVEIFLVASCHGNRDKLRPGGPLGSYADFTFTFTFNATLGILLEIFLTKKNPFLKRSKCCKVHKSQLGLLMRQLSVLLGTVCP